MPRHATSISYVNTPNQSSSPLTLTFSLASNNGFSSPLSPPHLIPRRHGLRQRRRRAFPAMMAVKQDAKSNTDDDNDDAPHPLMGRTENNSATYLSSDDPCLDFFFQVVPDTPADTVTALLSAAWNQDPLTALKLVCHLRGVRGTGKSDRKGFYAVALWLHSHHPKTLALNAGPVVDFGYMKDLPEILHRLVAGPRPKPGKPQGRRRGRAGIRKRSRKVGTREERLAAEMAKVKIQEETAASLRVRKRAEMAKTAAERYARDPRLHPAPAAADPP